MQERYQLSRKFRFEAAHRLANGYKGKCANIHGHSWNGEIFVSCVAGLDSFSFGVDFGDLKDFCSKIEAKYDHKLLLNDSDYELISLCEKNGWLIETFDANPTCEIVSKEIYLELQSYLKELYPKGEVVPLLVKIMETCNTSCSFFLKDTL